MNTVYPRRTVAYNSAMIDSGRWAHYAPRDGDIFICTPPKCGTTWTQAICALLIFGRPDLDVKPGVISPWFDADHFALDDMLDELDAQTHRRFIKTHTPLDGIPYYPQCRYLTVYRDPRDVHFSMRNHARNMQSERYRDRAPDDVGAGFRRWVEKPYAPGDEDNFSLRALVHHYRTYRTFAHLPNMLFLHYADMSRDLRRAMSRIAEFLGIRHDDAALDTLVPVAGFENMKRNASQFAPGAGLGRWKDESRFFNKGAGNQWDGAIDDDALDLYGTRMRALLPEEDIAWLQDGGTLA